MNFNYKMHNDNTKFHSELNKNIRTFDSNSIMRIFVDDTTV